MSEEEVISTFSVFGPAKGTLVRGPDGLRIDLEPLPPEPVFGILAVPAGMRLDDVTDADSALAYLREVLLMDGASPREVCEAVERMSEDADEDADEAEDHAAKVAELAHAVDRMAKAVEMDERDRLHAFAERVAWELGLGEFIDVSAEAVQRKMLAEVIRCVAARKAEGVRSA